MSATDDRHSPADPVRLGAWDRLWARLLSRPPAPPETGPAQSESPLGTGVAPESDPAVAEGVSDCDQRRAPAREADA